jgi:hypothetical protein
MKSSTSLRALTATLALIALGLAPSAFAFKPQAVPTGPFAIFGDCPLSAPNVTECVVAQTTGGQLTIGRAIVPLDHTVTLQGGIASEPETEITSFVPAADGNALLQTPLEVPGGLLDLIGRRNLTTWVHSSYNRWSQRDYAVTATLELVGPAQINLLNIVFQEGPALVLPSRLKLENRLLGDGCYIGSRTEPIMLEMIDGTTSPPPPNQPISGTAGSLSIEQEGSLLTLTGSSFVNNSFAVPPAEGCGPASEIDREIDRQVGLPSVAGSNTAIIDGTETVAVAPAVVASEE